MFFLLCLLTIFSVELSLSQRKLSEEAILFRKVKDGVFTVLGDDRHGSGFLIDSNGLVLTNQHVIANSAHISIQLDDSTKVSATLIFADEQRDLASLKINPTVVIQKPVLKLVPERSEIAYEGERVIAIGSPLHQSKIITAGIVSKVESGAIINDVNLNYGNSGGPLINLDGEVIAVNTFLDVSKKAGPGVSGSIRIQSNDKFIIESEDELKETPLPSAELLPVMPRDIFPLYSLQEAATASEWDDSPYDIGNYNHQADYDIIVQTPPYIYRKEKVTELQLSSKRQERESQGNASAEESYQPFNDLKMWAQYEGQYVPVVMISVTPKIGETALSFLGNIVGAVSGNYYNGTHIYEFKGDLKDVKLFVQGKPQTEIERGMSFVPLNFWHSDYSGTYRGSDLARSGQFIFSPECFAPIGGQFLKGHLTILSIDNPGEPIVLKVLQQTIERIWLDFEPYREQKEADNTKLIVTQ